MWKKYLIFTVLLALAIWAVWKGLNQPDTGRGLQVGALAPNFSLTDGEGKALSLESLRGKVVLLNFWATWCPPCQQEMPGLESLYLKFKDRNFTVLGVSLDEEGWDPIRKFLQTVPVTFPIVNDAEQKATDVYQIYRVPETYLIDKEGRIADKIVGPQDYTHEVFSKKIERLLSGEGS